MYNFIKSTTPCSDIQNCWNSYRWRKWICGIYRSEINSIHSLAWLQGNIVLTIFAMGLSCVFGSQSIFPISKLWRRTEIMQVHNFGQVKCGVSWKGLRPVSGMQSDSYMIQRQRQAMYQRQGVWGKENGGEKGLGMSAQRLARPVSPTAMQESQPSESGQVVTVCPESAQVPVGPERLPRQMIVLAAPVPRPRPVR